jgi:hypothetical protein
MADEERKLDKSRMSDLSYGTDVVVGHNQLEAALQHILSIENAKIINKAVFGTVTSDGEVTLMRLNSKDPAADPTAAVGFEFYDGIVRKRLVFTESRIQVWSADTPNDVENTSWTKVYDYEEVDEPNVGDMNDVVLGGLSDGKVLGWQQLENGSFAWVPVANQMATDGATDFLDLTDVSQYFQNLYGPGYGKLGYYVGVKDETMLHPVAAGEVESAFFSWRSNIVIPGRVGWAGLGTEWEPVPWSTMESTSTITSLTSFTGPDGDAIANAGVPLTPGVWRVNVAYAMRNHVLNGFVSWKVVGAQEFPQGQWARQHMAYKRVEAYYSPFAKIFETTDPQIAASGGQEQWLIVPENTTVALLVGRESAETCEVVCNMTIARIV